MGTLQLHGGVQYIVEGIFEHDREFSVYAGKHLSEASVNVIHIQKIKITKYLSNCRVGCELVPHAVVGEHFLSEKGSKFFRGVCKTEDVKSLNATEKVVRGFIIWQACSSSVALK